MTVAAGSGWQYLDTLDPGNGNYRLVRVVRSDGTEVPIQDFWQTDRTLNGLGQATTYENRIHLADDNSTGLYSLYFSVQTPNVAVTAPNAVYSHQPYASASASVTTPGGLPITDGQISYTYYKATDLNDPLPGAPTTVGTYEVVATFAGDGVYASASTSPVQFSITGAVTTLTGSAFYLELDADGEHLDIWNAPTNSGTPNQTLLLSDENSILINGSSTGTAVTIDYSNGDPNGGWSLGFQGELGKTNTLNVIGTAGNDSVTVNSSAIVESAAFGSATVSYTNLSAIAFTGGTGNDTLTQTAQPSNGATLSFLSTTVNDTLNVTGGIYTIPADASNSGIRSLVLGDLSIIGTGIVVLANSNGHADRSVLVLNTLTLADSVTLDLNDNDLIIHNGVLSSITSAIGGGFNASGANWQGAGIDSSAAANNPTHLTALGVLLNNDGNGNPLFGGGTTLGLFDNLNVATTDILIKYTFFGDLNLDGRVDGSDYSRIDNGSLNHLQGWFNGDLNYDGSIDGSDYTLIDNAFNTQGSQLSAYVPVLKLPTTAPSVTYDGTAGVTGWVVPTLDGVADEPAPTGQTTIIYYSGSAANGTPLAAPPQLPGTYTVVASYGGDFVYSAALSNAVTFTINRALASVQITAGPSVIRYDGTSDVTDWVKASFTGISGAAAATGTVSLVYYSGSAATGTPLASPPINVGTYTVVAVYGGDSNYVPSLSAATTFSISSTVGSTPLILSGPAYYLKLDADQLHLDIWAGTTNAGQPNQSVLLSTISSIPINGVSSGTTLTVDFGAGDPLVPSGLNFNGVVGAANTLSVVDTNDSSTTNFNVDATNVTVVLPNTSAPLTYRNVSAIRVLPGLGTDILTQNAQPGGGATLSYLGTTHLDSLYVDSGTFTFPASAPGTGITSTELGGAFVSAGAKIVVTSPTSHSDRTVLVLDSLFIAGSTNAWQGRLDLGGNDMIVHSGNLTVITSELENGFNSNWTGSGISSSAANGDSSHLTALGVEINNNGYGQVLFGTGGVLGSFSGQNPSLNDILVKYTYYGDANLDGRVDGSDYSRIDNGALSHLSGWANGDFNYDGTVNGSDYTLIDNAFNTQGASFAASISSPLAVAPAKLPMLSAADHDTSRLTTARKEIENIRNSLRSLPSIANSFQINKPITFPAGSEQSIEKLLKKRDLLDALGSEVS